jgi:hypothetical protein
VNFGERKNLDGGRLGKETTLALATRLFKKCHVAIRPCVPLVLI